jgi:methionyl-tRNA synthetase
MQKFFDFLSAKAESYGHQCPHCGGNDGFFALHGKCNLCMSPMLRYGKVQSLLFSLEAFLEFIDNYVKKGSVFENEEVRELLNRTVAGLK